MITRNEFKYYSSLLQKKIRDKENKFLAEGKRTVEEGIELFTPEIIFTTSEFKKNNRDFIDSISSLNIKEINTHDFKKLSDTVHSQGITAVFRKNSEKVSDFNFTESLVVFLDNISEPGNLGTIIRNCDWFGVNQILLSEGCADIYNPKTIRSTMGSIFHIKIFENISSAFLTELQNNSFQITSADINGSELFEEKFLGKNAVVFSNEAHGLSPKIGAVIDKRIAIPKFGKAESLNVASASAVILSFVRLKNG